MNTSDDPNVQDSDLVELSLSMEEPLDQEFFDDSDDDSEKDIKAEKEQKFDNLSLVRQSYLLYKEFISPPPIEVPVRQYSQRSENSGLPDSDYYSFLEAPVGESLANANYRLSKQANEAWKAWIQVNGDPFLEEGTLITPVAKSIESILFDESDIVYYTRLKRLNFVEEKVFSKENYAFASRLLQETVFRDYLLDGNSCTDYSGPNRFYSTYVVTSDDGVAKTFERKELDRCKNNTSIRRIDGISVPDDAITTYNPSLDERNYNINLTSYQTSVWREEYSSYANKNYLSNTTDLDDDPDFINPSSFSSRNFSIYPPASRIYNATFVVHFDNGTTKKIYPSKSLSKDYNSVSTIEYMLNSKQVKYSKVVIDEQIINDVVYPNCFFEPDLRVSYCSSDSLVPNFTSYKKVDIDTLSGKKILQLLNEQPNLWKEMYISEEDSKKLVVYYVLKHPTESNVFCVFWCYVDTIRNSLVKPRFLKKKITLPQYKYHYLYSNGYNELPNYRKRKVLTGISVRLSSNCYSFKTHRENGKVVSEIISFDQIVSMFTESLLSKGFKFVDCSNESYYNNVVVYRFVNLKIASLSKKTIFQELNHDFL